MFKFVNMLIFFGFMFIFDLIIIVINNYMDYCKVIDNYDYDYWIISNVIG